MNIPGLLKRAVKRVLNIDSKRTDAVVRSEYENLWGQNTRDWSRGPIRDEIWSTLTNIIELLKPLNVLEIGSGNGINIVELSKRFPQVSFTGVEFTAQGVSSSPQVHNAVFVQGDARDLPFGDVSFDFAFTSIVIEQIPRDYMSAFKETRRVAKEALFIEAFKEKQNLMQYLYLFSRDYFKSSYHVVEQVGWEVVSFQPFTNWKPEYRLSALHVK